MNNVLRSGLLLSILLAAGCGGTQTVGSVPAGTGTPLAGSTATPTPIAMGGNPTATPSPIAIVTPTASPTPTGANTINVAQSASSICGSGGVNTETLTATEAGYSGTYTATSQNPAVLTVTPTATSNGLFTVTATGANFGTYTITVRDTNNNYGTASVIVAECLQ